jgi:hypothetical protein
MNSLNSCKLPQVSPLGETMRSFQKLAVTTANFFLGFTASNASIVQATTLVNGNFKTRGLTGWTTFTTYNGTLGYGFPKKVIFDTKNNGTPTLSVQLSVGQVVFEGHDPELARGGGIFQNVSLGAGNLTITADIAASFINQPGTSNTTAGLFKLLFDNVLVASHDFEEILANTSQHSVLTANLQNIAAGVHEIRLQITRPSTAAGTPTYGVQEYIGNVELSGSATSPY